MMTDRMIEYDIEIDADKVFTQRLILARARASELTAALRGLANAEPAIMADNDREHMLGQLESALAMARHWSDSLRRTHVVTGPRS